jgi:hypothetical protein
MMHSRHPDNACQTTPESLYLIKNARKMKTKEEFHQLIDSIQDEKALQVYLELVRMLSGSVHQDGLFRDLSPEQREDIMQSYKESFDDDELVDHETVKAQFQKWR